MRAIPCSLVLVSSLVACGGAQKPPASADEQAAANRQAPDDPAATASPPAAPAASSPPAAAAPSAPASPSSPPATTTDSLGDVKAGADDPWLVGHQMPPTDVMKTMRGANGKVQACWKQGLQRDPSTSGEVKIRFVITNDGGVRVWRDDGSSMSDEEVTQCVGGVIQALKFPKQKSPGDAWGAYSIHFSP
jgi:hypothetical protein